MNTLVNNFSVDKVVKCSSICECFKDNMDERMQIKMKKKSQVSG